MPEMDKSNWFYQHLFFSLFPKKKVNTYSVSIYQNLKIPETGLEPVQLLRPGDFKSPVSTNSTTPANCVTII